MRKGGRDHQQFSESVRSADRLLFPQDIGHLPIGLGISVQILRVFVDDSLSARMGGMGSGFNDHFPENVGVVDDHAGAVIIRRVRSAVNQFAVQFFPPVVLARITAKAVQVATHGRAENQEEWRVESIPRVELLSPGVGGDEFIDDEVLSELGQAWFGASADGSPPIRP